MSNWNYRFMEMAKLVSTWSKDPSTQCGAVIVDMRKRVISMGFNGFPQRIEDDYELLKDRDVKLQMILHAEQNALLFANRDLSGCTIYTYPYQMCSHCTAMAIQKGIAYHVTTYQVPARWQENFDLANKMIIEAGVELKRISI